MRDIWKILLKILLCISICVVAIVLYVWGKQYFSRLSKSTNTEGFQSQTLITLGTGTYDGTPMDSSTVKRMNTEAAAGRTPSIETEFIILKLNTTTEFQKFSFDLPVQIFAGTTKVADARLFAYNKPNFLVIKSTNGVKWTTTHTGIKWSSTSNEQSKTTEYTIQAPYCGIPENAIETICLTQNADTFPAETVVEQNIYDMYELHNIENPPMPSYTQMEPYDMSSELSEFDVGATIPWDYDNRIFQPNDVLWGNIHPNVSQSIFNTAYTREVLKSVNNLEFDESNKKWSYRSLVFETTWSGDDKRFLPGIQAAEFIVETGIGIIVEGAVGEGEDRIMTKTAWGKKQTAILDSSDEARSMKGTVYNAAIKNNMSKSQATAYSKAYAAQYYNDRLAINSLPENERLECDAKRQAVLDSGEGPQKNKANLAKLIEANDAARAEADNLTKRNVVAQAGSGKNSTQIDTEISKAGTAKPSGIEGRLTKANIPDGKLKVKGIETKGIGSTILRLIGAKGAQRLTSVTAGKMAVKFSRAIGMTMASKGLLYGVATAICGPIAPFTAGGSCAVLYTAVTVINVFIDFFVIACCSFIPAILATYIPEDALCPPNYFNIRDAMVKLPGGEVGWQIVSAVPGFGDALGTFGPYLCSKVEGPILTDCVLKTPPVTPGYFYDSTLSIFCDTNKAPMRSDIPQFKDSRRYTRNGDITPKWSDSGIPPIWVDFSDKAILDKMAQFYYTYSRRLAINNYDGTYSFEYISKFYGVIASSLYTCDVQCEITRVSYYETTGIQQSSYIVPVDPANGTTYHDRRFYFYPIQVPDTSKAATDPSRVSAEKIQNMYRPKLNNYNFLTWDQRKSFVSGDNTQLNNLMNDNQMRYIVTACTNSDGTAPNAYEYNAEGDYVGDALISLGNGNSSASSQPEFLYYPPVVSLNNSMYTEITSAYTITDVNLGAVGTEVQLIYNNQLVTFIKPYRDLAGRELTGDTIKGIQINNSNIKQSPDKFFSGTVTNYQSGPPQIVTIKILTNTIPSGPKKYSLEITERSNAINAPTNDNNCSAIRNKAYKYGQTIRNNDDPNAGGNTPSFTITTRDFVPVPWRSFDRNSNSSDFKTGFNTAKIWNERYEGQIVSQSAMDKSILQGTAMGYIGFRVNIGIFPLGAVITGGIMNTNFDPEWSIASLMACSYQDTLQSYGTYVLNGKITTIHEGTSNRYLIIDRGPIIPFAPGYTPTINKKIVTLTQYDCINRNAIRRIVNTYNTANATQQVTKVLRIETDNSNKKCLYMFESVPFDSVTNTRNLNSKSNKVVTVGYNYSSTDYALIQGTTLNTTTLNSDGTYSPSRPNFTLSLGLTSFATTGDTWGELNINIPTSGFIPVTAPTATEDIPATKNLKRPGSSDNNKYTCASPNIYNRLVTQFNLKHKLNPQILSIINSYVPSSGTKNTDGTFTCIYNANIKSMNNDTGAYDTKARTITMTIVPANDEQRALYDLLEDNYPTAFLYQEVPKPNQWIDIPRPLIPEKNISRDVATCGSLSTCENLSLISNLVNKFNNQMITGKIMKVRKAYTPTLTSNVCDFEVEMLRNIDGISDSIIQKESIRLPIKASTTDPCMWDLDMTGTNIPPPDTGISLTNSASVSLLPNPYIWSPSYLTLIRNSINDALLNYLNIDINKIISNATVSVNRKVNRVYETILTAQVLAHPNPSCKLRCNDSNVIQSIINRYNADNYPTTQYGVQKARIVEIRRAGTYTSNQCQIEFIERVDTYKNFISSIIFSSDASNPDSQFNTKYYLRQYQFDMVPDQSECAHNIVPVANLVATNTINKLDISGNGLAIMSDASVIPKQQSIGFNYEGNNIDCTNSYILNAVKDKYRATARFLTTENYNDIQAFTTAFNQRANICEYNVKTKRWFKGRNNRYYSLDNQDVTIEAQWNSYNFRTGIVNYVTAPRNVIEPDIVREFDPASITMKLDSNSVYQPYNVANNQITLPYTYQIPSNYDRTRVSPLSVSYS